MSLFRNPFRLLIASALGAPLASLALGLGDALDTTNLIPNLVWITSPSNSITRPWSVETNTIPLDGADDAVSGNKNVVSTESWIETTVIGPGTISYWCKVSSEPPEFVIDDWVYFDYLKFEIGGVEIEKIAGPLLPWQYRSYLRSEERRVGKECRL